MKMKRSIFFSSLCLIIIFAIQWQKSRKSDQVHPRQFGILQTASHPALDQVREGFLAELKDYWGDDFQIAIFNAQGSVQQAQAAAQSLTSNKQIKAFLAIATPAVQSLIQKETQRPVIMAAVTNPEGIGVPANQNNICGVSDLIDTNEQASIIRRLFPHISKIAILYNPGEANSTFIVNKMEAALNNQSLEVLKIGATNEMEVPIAASKAFRLADAILIPTDNTMISSIQILSQESQKAKKPLITSDVLHIEMAALTYGVDYFSTGREAGRQLIMYMEEQKTPVEIGVHHSQEMRAIVNHKILTDLGVSIDPNLHNEIEVQFDQAVVKTEGDR